MLMARYTQIVFRWHRITGNESDAEGRAGGIPAWVPVAGDLSRAVQYGDLVLSHRSQLRPRGVGKRRPEAQSRVAEENDPERSEVQFRHKSRPRPAAVEPRDRGQAAGGDGRAHPYRAHSLCAAPYGRPNDGRNCSRSQHRSQCCQAGGFSRGAETQASTRAPVGKHMKHLEETELVEHYYEESANMGESERHLKACPVCAKRYAELCRSSMR